MANQNAGKAAPDIPALKPYRENPPYGRNDKLPGRQRGFNRCVVCALFIREQASRFSAE
jgi:hypothetical protein